MNAGLNLPTRAHIGFGQVHHARTRPVRNQFTYGNYFLMLPMRTLQTPAAQGVRAGWMPNRAGLISFHDRDQGDGRAPSEGGALAWLDALLRSQGIADANGEVWLQTYPRVLGYAFKPVSFWYCQRADGTLAAIVVEVNNTFGERHCYLLQGAELAYGRALSATKVFHVSPFCKVAGRYRFRFMQASDRTVARIDHEDDEGLLLQTSVSGHLAPLTEASARAAFFAMPAMSLMLMARIHWQALRLALKRVPFFGKPAAPEQLVTRT